MQDNVARIYQHTQHTTEFCTLSPIEKYCVGLARYVESPLNEFAALGSDHGDHFDKENLVSIGA